MQPRITLVTLGVDDLDRAVRFYRDGLGLRTEGIVGTEFEHGAVAFFDLQSGLKLALWPRKSIAHDTGIAAGRPNPADFTIGHNVSSKAEVDAVMRQASAAGAVVVKGAHDTFWGGYAGNFKDPDEHLWEVAWNPQWVAEDDMSTTRRLISSGSTFEAAIGYSRAVVDGEWIFVSGTTGFDYSTMSIADGVVDQARQCLKNIEAALAQAGSGLPDVVRVTYILPDGAQFEECWPVLREAFGEIRPAATMISAGLADPRMRIEIEVTARKRGR
jgi:enamine deaminase RidA (YjgF/YER057c/UK114 family)